MALVRATTADPDRLDVLPTRVEVRQLRDVAEVDRRLFLAGFQPVIVVDDGVQERREDAVRRRVGGVDADAAVQVLHSRLDGVEESGAASGLLVS